MFVFAQRRLASDAQSSAPSSPVRMIVRGVQRGGRFLVSSNMEFQLSPGAGQGQGAGQGDNDDQNDHRWTCCNSIVTSAAM